MRNSVFVIPNEVLKPNFIRLARFAQNDNALSVFVIPNEVRNLSRIL